MAAKVFTTGKKTFKKSQRERFHRRRTGRGRRGGACPCTLVLFFKQTYPPPIHPCPLPPPPPLTFWTAPPPLVSNPIELRKFVYRDKMISYHNCHISDNYILQALVSKRLWTPIEMSGKRIFAEQSDIII